MTKNSQKTDNGKEDQPRKPPSSPKAKTSTGAYYDSDHKDKPGYIYLDLDTSIKKSGEEAKKEIHRRQLMERAKEAIEEAKKLIQDRKNLEE